MSAEVKSIKQAKDLIEKFNPLNSSLDVMFYDRNGRVHGVRKPELNSDGEAILRKVANVTRKADAYLIVRGLTWVNHLITDGSSEENSIISIRDIFDKSNAIHGWEVASNNVLIRSDTREVISMQPLNITSEEKEYINALPDLLRIALNPA